MYPVTTYGKDGYWGELDDSLAKRILSNQDPGDFLVYRHFGKFNYYIAHVMDDFTVGVLSISKTNPKNGDETYSYKHLKGYDNLLDLVHDAACLERLNKAIKYDASERRRLSTTRESGLQYSNKANLGCN